MDTLRDMVSIAPAWIQDYFWPDLKAALVIGGTTSLIVSVPARKIALFGAAIDTARQAGQNADNYINGQPLSGYDPSRTLIFSLSAVPVGMLTTVPYVGKTVFGALIVVGGAVGVQEIRNNQITEGFLDLSLAAFGAYTLLPRSGPSVPSKNQQEFQKFAEELIGSTSAPPKPIELPIEELPEVPTSKYSVIAELEKTVAPASVEEGVAPSGNLRQLYTDAVAGLEKTGKGLLASGKSEAEVAKILNQMRRDLGVKYKDMTPSDLLDWIYKFNEARYGDKLGPTYEYLKKLGKTDAQIVESASRPLGDLKQLGAALYKQFGEEIAPILRKYGMLD